MKAKIAMFFLIISTAAAFALPVEEMIHKTTVNFSKIKDARADITFDSSLQVFGCGGTCRREGKLLFKAPDRLKISMEGETYIIKGNFIRKIDSKGKLFYIRLIHAPDFSIGFTPDLLPHNFILAMKKNSSGEALIEGLPKPGVLKNIKKVVFCINTNEYLLKSMVMEFHNKRIVGDAEIKYNKINNIWVPYKTKGRSALEIADGFLAGFYFNLEGKNFVINSGVLDSEFN